MVTGHGRATPLLWKTVASSTLKGNQRRYEYEVLCRLREVLPAGVKVTVVADRGFGDCAAAAWVGAGGRARRLVGARVTDTYELPVGVVVCVHAPKMGEATVPTRVLQARPEHRLEEIIDGSMLERLHGMTVEDSKCER